MSDLLQQRNALRMKVWELEADLLSMLAIPQEYRNDNKITQLECELIHTEAQIRALTLEN